MTFRDTGNDASTSIDDGDDGRDAPAAPRRTARQRRVLLIPLGLIVLVVAGLIFVFTSDKDQPSTMIGATGSVNGGLARINGVIPLETDGWTPAEPATELTTPVQEGAHRVRVLLELTALEPEGVNFNAGDYSIDGLGTGSPVAVWSSPVNEVAPQGGTIHATLVFEIPNEAISLVLDDGDDLRLSLGTDHHTTP